MSETLRGLLSRKRAVALMVVVALAVGLVGAGASVATAGTASIKGTVRDKDGNALPGVTVKAYVANADRTAGAVETAVSAADGSYTLGSLDADAYKVEFTMPGLATQWWDKKASFEMAAGILVGDASALTSYDATLQPSGKIAVKLTAAAGVVEAIDGVVRVYDSLGNYVRSHHIGSGDVDFPNWVFDDLQPGTYRLTYTPDDPHLLFQWFDGKATRDGATAVVVGAGATATADFTIKEGGTIKGRVTNETTGMPDVTVFVRSLDDLVNDSASTDATGNYEFTGLPVGQYRIWTSSPDDDYVDEYYNDKVDPWKADALALSGVETKTADFQLAKGSSIAGNVTGPAAQVLPFVTVRVTGTTDDGQYFTESTSTEIPGGPYVLKGIPNGKFTVYFDASELNRSNITTLAPSTGFASEFWNDKPWAAMADKIVFTAATAKTGVDAQLGVGGEIKGTVTGSNGAPIGGLSVSAVMVVATDSFSTVRTTYTSPDGTYDLNGLPAGTYIVAYGNGYNFYPNGKTTLDSAGRITVAAGQTTAGINSIYSLERGGVRFHVSGPDGRAALNGYRVIVAHEQPDGTYTEAPGDFFTGSGGEFTIYPGEGKIKVRFTDPYKRYADTAYPNVITVTPGIDEYVQQTLPFIPTDSAEGADRFGTCVEVSRRAFANGAYAIVVATGRNWPDALGGAGLAGMAGAPILLVEKDSIPDPVMTEIQRLDNKGYILRVYILGSESVVSKKVEDQFRTMFDFRDQKPSVIRLAGATRYDTANAIAGELTQRLGTGYDGTALVSTGLNYPDALAASPLAVLKRWPLYLIGAGGVTQAQLDGMAANGVKRVIMLGSASVLPKATVEDKLATKFGAANVSRLAGGTRYTTAIEIAKYGVTEQGMKWSSLGFATGTNFPDALSGGILQAYNNTPMLLTPGNALDPSVESLVKTNKASIYQTRFYGSVNAINKAVRDKIAAARQ